MATSRHAMLAGLRGRFDVASALGRQVAEQARRIGLPDANRLPGAVTAVVAIECTEETGWQAVVDDFYAIARRLPGHLYEATAARILAGLGRWADAAAELDRLLPRAVTASGPRWVGAMTDLAVVAAETGNREAAARLYRALLPYRHRLVVWGGAVTVTGPVAHYLGLLAAAVGDADSAVSHLREALSIEERVTALPALAHSLATFGDALTLRGGAGDAQQASDSRRRAHELADRLGMTVLLGRLVPPADEWTLRRDGTGWLLEAGPERVRMADSQGLRHLRALLAVPRHDIPAVDLAAGGTGPRSAGSAPVLDAPAVTAYRRRLSDLDAELDSADAAGDARRAARADAERQWLLGELRRATGLGGRSRRASSESERARVNVTRTLRSALDRIAVVAPRVGAHLQASIRTGLACRYDPAPGGPTRWRV